MSLKDMRVGQDWDEDLGRWIPRGYADVPVTRSEKQGTMSLGPEFRGLQRCTAGDTKLVSALPVINCSEISKPSEMHTSPCSVVDKVPSGDPEPAESNQNDAVEAETQDSAAEELLPDRDGECAATLGDAEIAKVTVQEPAAEHRDVSMELAIVPVNGNIIASPNCDGDIHDLDDDSAREQLTRAGWNITQNIRKTGKAQWYYRAPGGTLLGSLRAAIAFWEKQTGFKTVVDNSASDKAEAENPTLDDLKLQRPAVQERRELENSMQIVSPPKGTMSVVVIPDEVAVRTPALVNGFFGPGSLTALLASCMGKRADSKMLGAADFLKSRAPKRSASEVEEFDQARTMVELKRRKISAGTAEQSTFQLKQENEFTPRRGWIESEEDAHMTDVKIVSLTSKKRVCTAEEIVNDPNIFRAECISTIGCPKTKKSRAISTESVSTPEGKGRKSLLTLQESLQNPHNDSKYRKKPFSPFRATDFKHSKKSFTPDFKQVKKSAKKSKKGRAPPRSGFRLEVLLSAPSTKSGPSAENDTLMKKRTLLSWLIDNGMVEEHDRVRYLNRKDNHCMLEGYVTREGIRCDCCGNIVTLSVFEAHAGSKLHRPSANIFLSNGKSLSECQVELLARKNENEGIEQKADDQESGDKSDDTCGICGDGGQLICCDHCPSTFHLECMGMEAVPDGDWFCPNCRCSICGGSQFNGDKSCFNDLTVIFCDQCECEYHVKCLRTRGIELDSCPQEDWFCGETCGKIFRGLRGLVGASKPMEGGFSWTLLRSQAEDDRKSGCVSNTELNAEHDSKLSIALSVMQECFRPMIDPRTKIDIVSHVLYNRRSEVSRLNYHGFYTMLLERGDELISVATIRVHGARLAEMPLIGTRFAYRRQGMCRRLMSALEEMLRSIGVERLVLPAVPELLETWTGAFGFMSMHGSERLKLMDLNIMAFPGTSLLYKPLDKSDVPRICGIAGGMGDQVTILPSCQPGKVVAASKSHKKSVLTAKKRGRPPRYKESIGKMTDVNGYAEYYPDGTGGDVLRLENAVARTPLEDDRKKFVCPAEARKKRGRFARPRKGNLFGNFLSPYSNKKSPVEKNVVDAVSVPIEQVARFGEESSGILFRPASPTGSVSVDFVRSEHGSALPAVASEDHHFSEVKREVETGADVTETIAHGDELPLRKAAAVKLEDSVSGVDQLGASVSAQPKWEDVNGLPCGRSTSGENRPVEEDEELDHSWAIRSATHSTKAKTPEWLVDSIKEEAANTPTRPVVSGEKAVDTRGPEGQFQHRIPPLETATACSTKTYERRRSKLSPLSQKEPLSRLRAFELADSDPISRTLDFTLEELDSVQYVELEPVAVPMKIFPSQISCQHLSTMPPRTFSSVQVDVVHSSFRRESRLPDRPHAGTASCEDISGGSYDQNDGESSRGSGLMVRLKLNVKVGKKKKQPKEMSRVGLPKVEECTILPEEILKSSVQGASCSSLETTSIDKEVTSPDPVIQGSSEERERAVESQYISVMVN